MGTERRVWGRGTRGSVGTQDQGTGKVSSRRPGGEIGDAGYIAEKREKVAINKSKKLICSKETAPTSAIFLSIRIDLPITENTFLWLGGKKHATYRDKNGVTHSRKKMYRHLRPNLPPLGAKFSRASLRNNRSKLQVISVSARLS